MWVFSLELQLKTSRGKTLHSIWKTESRKKRKSGWVIILKSKLGGRRGGERRTGEGLEGDCPKSRRW